MNWIWGVSVLDLVLNKISNVLLGVELHYLTSQWLTDFQGRPLDEQVSSELGTWDSSCPEGSPFPLPRRRDGTGWVALLTHTQFSRTGHPRTSSVCPVLSPKPVPSIYHVWPSNIPTAKTQRSRAARCKVPCPLPSLSLSLFHSLRNP